MKIWGLALIIAVGASEQAAAGAFVDGNKLFDSCTRNDASISDCAGYVAGVADSLVGNSIGSFRACFPEQATRAQIRDVAIQWLQRHPENRHYNAAGLVAAALSEAFPCR